MPEINLICLKPRKSIKYNKNVFYLEKGKAYADNWDLLSTLKGQWYRVYSHKNHVKNDYVCGAYDLIEGTITSEVADYYKSIILDEYDILFRQDNLGNTIDYVEFLDDKVSAEFITLLNNALVVSKVNIVVVLFRESLDPPEKVIGNISLDKFKYLLSNHQIYENVAYIVNKRDINKKYWELSV